MTVFTEAITNVSETQKGKRIFDYKCSKGSYKAQSQLRQIAINHRGIYAEALELREETIKAIDKNIELEDKKNSNKNINNKIIFEFFGK